ncbi:hypothetical protein PARHAE_01059 [Paracoccus haematequi]|uniref:FAS1-like dehydratase domain-containing protein n=1 Tax=Paracoccus haematequi TaxID=2491866 RepID=A0A447IK90_9RHOB|nr:MaoC family dehydratase N-terminal domain-containing protein [Paracoccus haematequi]VDS07880.1 hypothetical protein PARHAE_01059 [Paracoccus haematequi]
MSLQDWIGRKTLAEAPLSPRLIDEHKITFGDWLADMEAPPGLHWALSPQAATPDQMGRDGHPRLGIHLPDPGLPRRMWAGGQLRFHLPFASGDQVRRESEITAVSEKNGRSGRLAFVTLSHHCLVGDRLHVSERQDIVYRDDTAPGAAAPVAGEAWPGAISRDLETGPVLLFRYSAMTFNSHRIHYDLPYATGVEHYEGLVVHGPMQALFMMNAATGSFGALPARFDYRGLSPLIAGVPALMEQRPAKIDGQDGLELRIRRADGVVTMQAQALPPL